MIAFVMAALVAAATSPAADGPGAPTIDTTDVTRFYALFDATGGHPSAEQLQHDYLDPGSDGLHELARQRAVTGDAMARAIAAHPGAYADARRCMAALPAVKVRLVDALATLRRLYPRASFPPITIAVSRTKPVGMTDRKGVRIGLEALCATNYLNPNVEDRFVHVIAHEYAHIQQDPTLADKAAPTVLEASLIEGAAEFTAELTSGDVGNRAPGLLAKGHEREIEMRFLADVDKTDLSAWLYNGTNERPGDLGYWVGYRIVKSYYLAAPDKRRAFAEILEMRDAKAFLRRSGWRPGMRLAAIASGSRTK